MVKMLGKHGLVAQRISAVDGKTLKIKDKIYDDKRARQIHNRSLKPAELGCSLSHRKALQAMIKNKDQLALILESDARLTAPIEHLNSVITRLGSIKEPMICLLFTHGPSPKIPYAEGIMQFPEGCRGTVALVVNKAGADVLLDNMFPITSAYDGYTTRLTQSKKLLMLLSENNIFDYDDQFESTIQGQI
jgi:GR25 family glycosyltransferase involved in LPS biosynthesis